jgi:hypothetical protein
MPLSPDRPAIRVFRKGDPLTADRFNELQGAVITDIQIHGPPGTRTIRKGNSLAIFLPTQPAAPPGVFWVQVAGDETGIGYYYGNVLMPPVATLNPLSPAPGDNGEPNTEEIVILNTGPLETGHVLTDTTDGPVSVTDFLATWWGMTNEDPPRRVARIFGLNPYECSGGGEEMEAMVADDNDPGTELDDGTY